MTTPPERSRLMQAVSEPAIYGVILVAGLVVIVEAEALWLVLTKVLATLLVFWFAHVYAAVVAHLGDSYDDGTPTRTRLAAAFNHALSRSWGMLLAGIIPVVVLALGVIKVLSDNQAIWGTLWLTVLVLGVLGWLGVAAWTRNPSRRIMGAVATALFGVLLIGLKVLVH